MVAEVAISVLAVLGAAFVVQYLGLLAERWFFIALANHPQTCIASPSPKPCCGVGTLCL